MERPASCLAPNCSQVRISNHHCQFHSDSFKPKYLKYKDLQNKLIRLDNLDRLSLPELMQRYNAYAKVYKLRRNCMRKYFRLEAWDAGHNLMSASIWYDLLKIENWIAKQVNSTSNAIQNEEIVEDEENEETLEVEDPQAVIIQHKQFLIWESLKNPQSCLAKQYQKEMADRKRLFDGILNWLRPKMILDPTELNQNSIEECLQKTLSFVIQAINAINLNISANSRKTIFYQNRNWYDYYSCCLRVFFQCLLRNEKLSQLFAYFFVEVLGELRDLTAAQQVRFLWNWQINDQVPILTSEDVVNYDKKIHKDYFGIVYSHKRNNRREITFGAPEGINSLEEWIQNPKIKCDPRFVTGESLRSNDAKIFLLAFVDISAIPTFSLSHQCGLSDCSYCLSEIEKEQTWGTLHPK